VHISQEVCEQTLPSALFDPRAILSIKQFQQQGQPDILRQFIGLFLTSANVLMQDFQQGVESKDMSSIYQALHTLKSSSAHLGASRFIELCTLIQVAAFQNDSSAVNNHAGALQAQFDEIEKILLAYLTIKEEET